MQRLALPLWSMEHAEVHTFIHWGGGMNTYMLEKRHEERILYMYTAILGKDAHLNVNIKIYSMYSKHRIIF